MIMAAETMKMKKKKLTKNPNPKRVKVKVRKVPGMKMAKSIGHGIGFMNSELKPDFLEFGLDYKKFNSNFIRFEKKSGFNFKFISKSKYRIGFRETKSNSGLGLTIRF